MGKLTIPKEELLIPGHMGCLGCGGALAMRYVLKALGPRTIVSVPACCWAIMSGIFPNTCLRVPMVNTAFETTGASISGIRAALDALGKKDEHPLRLSADIFAGHFVCIHKTGDKKEVIADSMQSDCSEQHPDFLVVRAHGKECIS